MDFPVWAGGRVSPILDRDKQNQASGHGFDHTGETPQQHSHGKMVGRSLGVDFAAQLSVSPMVADRECAASRLPRMRKVLQETTKETIS